MAGIGNAVNVPKGTWSPLWRVGMTLIQQEVLPAETSVPNPECGPTADWGRRTPHTVPPNGWINQFEPIMLDRLGCHHSQTIQDKVESGPVVRQRVSSNTAGRVVFYSKECNLSNTSDRRPSSKSMYCTTSA